MFLLVAFKGKRHAYSNLGYTVLGQVIERTTGQAYEEFMTSLLKSVGINQMKIGRTRKKDLGFEEVGADVVRMFLFVFFTRIPPPPLPSSQGSEIPRDIACPLSLQCRLSASLSPIP